jgi:hypothetical protein
VEVREMLSSSSSAADLGVTVWVLEFPDRTRGTFLNMADDCNGVKKKIRVA